MLTSLRAPLPAVVVVVLGFWLWPSLLTIVLLSTSCSAFFVGAPPIHYYSNTQPETISRVQQQQQKQQQQRNRRHHHYHPRSLDRGEGLSMNLRMSPKQPLPTKVAFQVGECLGFFGVAADRPRFAWWVGPVV